MRISTCTLAVLAAVWASASWAVVPNVSDSVIQSQNTILKDPKIQKIYQDLSSPESAKERFNTHMELVRIASPSREEFRRSAEIHSIVTRKLAILIARGIVTRPLGQFFV